MKEYITLKGGEVDVGGAPEIISVLPLGLVKSQKGDFVVDEESLEAMKAQIAKRGVDVVVDYEHQTLTGERAPAAGWVKDLFLDAGAIKARVDWTPAAKEYLANKEYRYLSPVIQVRKSDSKAMGLHSLALTNTPAIEGMTPIVNKSSFEGGLNTMEDLIKKLKELLGLGEDAPGEQVLEALEACLNENKTLKEAAGQQPTGQPSGDGKEAVVANKAILELLGLKQGAAPDAVQAEVKALKSTVTELKARIADKEAEEAVQTALKAGKLAPSMKEWAKEYALKSPEGFAAYVAAAPQVVPMDEIAGGSDPAPGGKKLDEATSLVLKQLGVDAEDVEKYGMKED